MAKTKVLKSTLTSRVGYELNDTTDPVMLDIKIGAAQQGGVTNVKLEDPKAGDIRIIADGHVGSFEAPREVGTNDALAKKLLKISTLIQDLSDTTDDTFLDIQLTGGMEDFRQRMEKTVSSQGETLWYTVTVRFFKVIT